MLALMALTCGALFYDWLAFATRSDMQDCAGLVDSAVSAALADEAEL